MRHPARTRTGPAATQASKPADAQLERLETTLFAAQAPGSTPIQSVAPSASKSRNRPRPMRVAPASAVATKAKPGTNVATISDGAPRRVKIDSVRRAQRFGESETSHGRRWVTLGRPTPTGAFDMLAH